MPYKIEKLLFGRQLKLRKPSLYQDVKPGKALLDVRNVYAVAVILGQYLGKGSLQLLGRRFGADGRLTTRVLINARKDIGQGNIVAFGNIEISVSALTFEVADAFMRLPSSSDSTITPRCDCATYLKSPGWPEMAKISLNSMLIRY